MNTAALLAKLQARPPTTNAYAELADFLQNAPSNEIDALGVEGLAAAPAGGAWFDTILSVISDDAFTGLVSQAVATLGQRTSCEACESVIAYASLQLPGALRPHLSQLFELRPNEGTYYEDWPWREAGHTDIAFLRQALDSSRPADRENAIERLFETRTPEAMTVALDAVRRAKPKLRMPAETYLKEIGYESIDRPLYSAQCAHLVFPADYFSRPRAPWSTRALHPTWRLPAEGAALRFGGTGSTACGLCGGQLHHLVTLPEAHVFGSVGTGVGVVSLETCLSCLGMEQPQLTYRHGSDGHPQSLDEGDATPEYPATPLRETRVHLTPTPARWRWQDWALSNSRENLNRVGGYPCWIQSADFPECLTCDRTMHFMMQLDSELPTSDGKEWLWGSGGIGYGFRCAPCRNTAFLWQCT